MTLEDLIRRFRIDATDTVIPYLFPDEWVIEWLNDAEAEAALRGRLILDSDSPAVGQIASPIGVTRFALHPAIYEIVSIRHQYIGEPRTEPLSITTREALESRHPDWRNAAARRPEHVIQDDTSLTIWPATDRPGQILIEGYRLPVKRMENDTDKPEIHQAHHRHLVQWALHKAFSRPDADTIDPQRAAIAEKEFTRYFGLRPNADLRRSTRHDLPQTNHVHML